MDNTDMPQELKALITKFEAATVPKQLIQLEMQCVTADAQCAVCDRIIAFLTMEREHASTQVQLLGYKIQQLRKQLDNPEAQPNSGNRDTVESDGAA